MESEHPILYITPAADLLYNRMANGEEPSLEEFEALEFNDRLRLGAFQEVQEIFEKVNGFRGAPLLNGFSLDHYQIEVLMWMHKISMQDPVSHHGCSGGILRLEMGLGKTLVSLIYGFMHRGPFLIASSLTLMENWISEFKKFFGSYNLYRVKVLHKTHSNIKLFSSSEVDNYDFVFTTYDVIKGKGVSERAVLASIYETDKGKFYTHRKTAKVPYETHGAQVLFTTDWAGIFADESQNFANEKTSIYKSMMALTTRKPGTYWCLTGTPIRNHAADILFQLRFIGYGNPTTCGEYDPSKYINKTEWKNRGADIFRAHSLDDHVYSLGYREAGIHIPDKNSYLFYPTFSDIEKKFYASACSLASAIIAKFQQKIASYASVLAVFILLRQVCIAPYLINPEAKIKRSTEETAALEDIRNHLKSLSISDPQLLEWVRDKRRAGFESAKIKAVLYYTHKVVEKGEKVIIFNTFSSALMLIKEAIEDAMPRVGCMMIDGNTDSRHRTRLIEEFKHTPGYKVLLINTKVGSEGLNITAARYTINPGMWWSPAADNQAEARTHRRGQTEETFCITLAIQDSVEQRIIDVCARKRLIERDFSGRRNPSERPDRLDVNVLKGLLG